MTNTHVAHEGGLTQRVAEFAASVRYEDLPPELIEVLKRITLDTLGTILAANTLGAGCRESVFLACATGGPADSTLIGFRQKSSLLMAAFTNGGMAHALNYDALGPSGGHLGLTAVPVPLALAEQRGGVSGKEFLTAAAIAVEVTSRLAAALTRAGTDANERFLEGQLLGYFGIALAAGRLLGLNKAQMHSALGLAQMQASGTMEVVFGGDPPAKAIYGAFPNHGGLLAALLSKHGVGAEIAALEGRAGLYGLFYNGKYDHRAITDGLGSTFLATGARFKPWPTSGNLHPFIEATIRLVQDYGISPAAVDRVHLQCGAHAKAWCEPLAERRHPANAASAANSIPFGVAKVLVNGRLTLADFTEVGLIQPQAHEVAERIDYEVNESLQRAGVVEVTTRDGRHYTIRVDAPRGHADNPMTHEQLLEKFLDCVQYAEHPLGEETTRSVIEFITRLEEVPDVAELLTLIA